VTTNPADPNAPLPVANATIEPPIERVIFARNFCKARKMANLSQRDVHRLTGLAQSYISEVERCLRNPSLDNMIKLAHVVNRPLYLLLKP
jgi:transcriptional regulator with XRE-family HTH domain